MQNNIIICPHCGKPISFDRYRNARNKAQAAYYKRHKEQILEKARQKRLNDPEYRQKANQYQLNRYYQKKEERNAEKLVDKTNA